MKPPDHAQRLRLTAGAFTFDELVELVVPAFEPASLSADEAIHLRALIDYIAAELETAHGHTFRALCCASNPSTDHSSLDTPILDPLDLDTIF